MILDFAGGDPIMSYLFCVFFKNLPLLEIIVHKVGDGNRIVYGVGDVEISDRVAAKFISKHGVKRPKAPKMFLCKWLAASQIRLGLSSR